MDTPGGAAAAAPNVVGIDRLAKLRWTWRCALVMTPGDDPW